MNIIKITAFAISLFWSLSLILHTIALIKETETKHKYMYVCFWLSIISWSWFYYLNLIQYNDN